MVRVATKGKTQFQSKPPGDIPANLRTLARPTPSLQARTTGGWIRREVAVRIESVIRRGSQRGTGRSEPAARERRTGGSGWTERAAGRREHPPAPSPFTTASLRPRPRSPPEFLSKARRVWGSGGGARSPSARSGDLRPATQAFSQGGRGPEDDHPPLPPPPPPLPLFRGPRAQDAFFAGRWRKTVLR